MKIKIKEKHTKVTVGNFSRKIPSGAYLIYLDEVDSVEGGFFTGTCRSNDVIYSRGTLGQAEVCEEEYMKALINKFMDLGYSCKAIPTLSVETTY